MFHASVFAVNDGLKPLIGNRVTARILDQKMNPALSQHWTLTVPAGGTKSDSHEVTWRIPADMPEGYFFLEVTMKDAQGRRVSSRAYWLRVLASLASPDALAKWQAKASAETMSTNGPWLKPQIEDIQTNLSGTILSSKVVGSELHLTVMIKNIGTKPAYPVQLSVESDVYSSLWDDNYFWLPPGESRTVEGTVRLDMNGLDPVTNPAVVKPSDISLSISAWNAIASKLKINQATALTAKSLGNLSKATETSLSVTPEWVNQAK
jgi:beta-mannosidase